jgi:acetyltransferase-like isoleucine patch superfamily enzyme
MIHPTAIVSEKAVLGSDVTIGPFTIVHEGVTIGKGSTIGSHCEIGLISDSSGAQALSIGDDSNIRSHSIFYLGSSFGDGLITGHRVTVRESTRAGKNLQIGTLSDIQGDCTFGDYVRLHSNVHIGKGSTIGNFVWIFPYVVLTNDPHPPSETCVGVTIEDFAVLATMSTILPGIKISTGALVGAHSLVNRDVAPDTIVVGVPAKPVGPTNKIKLSSAPGEAAYPWRKHFHKGYPFEVITQWELEND